MKVVSRSVAKTVGDLPKAAWLWLPLFTLGLILLGILAWWRYSDYRRASYGKPSDSQPNSPYIVSHESVVDKMLEAAEIKESDLVYDLGCRFWPASRSAPSRLK